MTAIQGQAVAWDYSNLAEAYLKRPAYSERGVDAMLAIMGAAAGASACDVGAGVGHLTIPLARRGLKVTAVEPNAEMQKRGVARTTGMPSIAWRTGTGEATGCESAAFDVVTFGSSFNVTDRPAALKETHRLLRPRGWFACMWNHRDLDDPLQSAVEDIIRSFVPGYDYGTRREDQTAVIRESGLFETPYRIEAPVTHRVPAADWVDGWRSHATLDRQSDGRLAEIVRAIDDFVLARGEAEITVPYTTRIWVAQAV